MRKAAFPDFASQWTHGDPQKISVMNNDTSNSLSSLSQPGMIEDEDNSFFRLSDPLSNHPDSMITPISHESDEDVVSSTFIKEQDSVLNSQHQVPLPYQQDEGDLELSTFSEQDTLFGFTNYDKLDVQQHSHEPGSSNLNDQPSSMMNATTSKSTPQTSESSGVLVKRIGRFPTEIVKILEDAFHNNENPDQKTISELAIRTRLPEMQVARWFARARMRKRKNEDQDSVEDLSSFTSNESASTISSTKTSALSEKSTSKKKGLDTLFAPMLDENGGISNIEYLPKVKKYMKLVKKTPARSFLATVLLNSSEGCLKHFVYALDGLSILREWLQDAKQENKPALVKLLLKVLDKIPVTLKILESCPIGKTVNNLIKNSLNDDQIAQRAKALVQKWKQAITAETQQKQQEPLKRTQDAKMASKKGLNVVTKGGGGGGASAAAAAAAGGVGITSQPSTGSVKRLEKSETGTQNKTDSQQQKEKTKVIKVSTMTAASDAFEALLEKKDVKKSLSVGTSNKQNPVSKLGPDYIKAEKHLSKIIENFETPTPELNESTKLRPLSSEKMSTEDEINKWKEFDLMLIESIKTPQKELILPSVSVSPTKSEKNELSVFEEELNLADLDPSLAEDFSSSASSFNSNNKNVSNNNNNSNTKQPGGPLSATFVSTKVVPQQTGTLSEETSQHIAKKRKISENEAVNITISVNGSMEVPSSTTTPLTETQTTSGGQSKKKKKRVSWAPDDKLVQIRIFTKEEGEEHHKDFKSALKEQLKDERNQLTLLKKREEEEWRRKTKEMAPTAIWIPPPKIDMTGIVTKLSAGLKSEETDRQIAREKTIFMATYLKETDIPPNPKNPPPDILANGIYDDNEIVNIPFDEISDTTVPPVEMSGSNLVQQLLGNPQLLLQALTANTQSQPQPQLQLQQPQPQPQPPPPPPPPPQQQQQQAQFFQQQILQLLPQLSQQPQFAQLQSQYPQSHIPLQPSLQHPQPNALALLNLLSQFTQQSQQQQQTVQTIGPLQQQPIGLGMNLTTNNVSISSLGTPQTAISYPLLQHSLTQQLQPLPQQNQQQQFLQTGIGFGRGISSYPQTVHYPHVGHESHPQHGEPFRERKETRLPGRGEGGHGSHGPQLNYRNSTVPLHQNQTFQHNPNIPISHSDIISPNISNQFNNNNINILSLKPPTQQI